MLIGGLLDIYLISDPPPPPPHRGMFPKCGNLCGQKGWKRGQDVTYLSLHPMPLPPPRWVERVKGRRCHFAHLWS